MPPRITLEERQRRAAEAAARSQARRPPAGSRGRATASHLQQEVEDSAPISKAEFSRTMEVFAASLDRLNNRLNDIAGRTNEPDLDTPEDVDGDIDGDDTTRTVPFRGSFGECPPVDERFSFVDKKVLDLALAGKLPAEKLPLLIPSSTDIYHAAAFEGLDTFVAVIDPETKQFFAAPPKNSTGQLVDKLVKAIPNIAVFVYAWSNLIDLMMHGCGEPESASQIFVALNNHSQWMIESSVNFTWESLIRYHLRVCAKRFSADFHVDLWYNAWDGQAGTLLKPIQTAAQTPTARSSTTAAATTKGNTAAGAKRKRAPPAQKSSGETCLRFQIGQCPFTPDKCARSHTCSAPGCGADHPMISCTKKNKAKA